MISEDMQDQAALYALGLLDADEATAFERAMAADGELRALMEELRETVASLARTDAEHTPPPGLKGRVLARIAEEAHAVPTDGKIIAGPRHWTHRLPWAAVAVLMICCGALAILCWKQFEEGFGQGYKIIDAERRAQTAEAELAEARTTSVHPGFLSQIVFCALEPAKPPTGPQAAVLWDAAGRRGQLRIQKLPRPEADKDYQLWVLEAGRKNAVSAGVVKLDADGNAAVDFQPGADDETQARVTAFALSVERAGGAPQNEGPILFVGQLGP